MSRNTKGHEPQPDWLTSQTGRSLPDWILYIQKRIVKRSRPSKDPNHDETDTAAWVADLEKEVRKSWKKVDLRYIRRIDSGGTVSTGHPKPLSGEKAKIVKVKDRRPFDGNMRIAATMGMILCAWYCRVQLAKTQDPTRPLKLRRESYLRWAGWYQANSIAMVDGQHDPEMFPGQEWESPFLPGARDGKFV